MKLCVTCPRCGARINTPVLLCPRCREPLPLSCDGNCKGCATKGSATKDSAAPPAAPTSRGGL